MATPKSLVAQLHKHWDVVEEMARRSRDLPVFNEQEILGLVQRYIEPGSETDPAAVLRSLHNSDVVQILERTDGYQLNPLVLDFVRGLTKEHELGLSAVLKAKIDAIQLAVDQIAEGSESHDFDLMKRSSAKLADLLRQIKQQLEQDRHAILEIAESAKSTDASIPVSKRYRDVLDAYDQYVEPMNEMMDVGLKGAFYPQLEKAERVLEEAVDLLSVRGALYTQRLMLRQVSYQVKELRRIGRVIAQQCSDTLLPLREEARQQNSLSSAVSFLLGRIRKNGLGRGLRDSRQTSTLPVWQRERRTRIHLGDEVRNVMAQAAAFEPVDIVFPEAFVGDGLTEESLVDEKEIRDRLADVLPVDNLMVWLYQNYAHLNDPTLLRLYHDLVREPLWESELTKTEQVTDLASIRVRYFPHQLLSNGELKS